MDVLAILNKKSRRMYTVSVDQSVDDAINLMVAKKVDALMVTDAQRPVGIFTKRDIFEYYLLSRKDASSGVKLERIMTDRLMSAGPADDVEDIISMMIKSDLYQLPVIEDNKILGLLALTDLVEVRLESLTSEIQHLKDYIDDLHEAGQD